MDLSEREALCKIVAVLGMWGHGWIGSTLMEKLDEKMPADPPWWKLYKDLAEDACRDYVGTITDEDDLQYWMSHGYWLVNWDGRGCALFNPPPMNGLYKYVSKELAEKYRRVYA